MSYGSFDHAAKDANSTATITSEPQVRIATTSPQSDSVHGPVSPPGKDAEDRPDGADGNHDGGDNDNGDRDGHQQLQTPSSIIPTIGRKLKNFYTRNFGLFLVFVAQTFGSIMNTAAKLLTVPDQPNSFHALHIIFIRMFFTFVLSVIYMTIKRVPDPIGKRGIRMLLILRGLAGFTGLFGVYYSLSWMEISDATAITFLTPTIAGIVSFFWLREPYTWQEALAGVVAFAGVLLVARPAVIFGDSGNVGGNSIIPPSGNGSDHLTNISPSAVLMTAAGPPVSMGLPPSTQRAIAVAFAVLGACAAAVAYSTIRVIGKRAHSLVSVNYFAFMACLCSAIIIAAHPDLQFMLPQGAWQWGLLVLVGIAGFLLQFLLTEGLQREKAGRATNMTYIQMVWALIIERVIWGTVPPPLSLGGSALIIAAAIWLSLQKSKAPPPRKETPATADEESSLLGRTQSHGRS